MTTTTLMPMETLFEHGPEEYLRLHQPSADDLIAYMHIPKAAGNSVIGAIKESFPSVYHVTWNNIDRSFNEMIATYETHHYKLVSGHFRHNQLQKLDTANIPHINISMIRDPIDRIVSQYRYMCTSSHPSYKSFKTRYPLFEDFALSGQNDNMLSHYLTGSARSAEDAYAEIVRKFHFVGLTEYMHESNFLIQSLLGCNIVKPDKLNVTQKKSYNQVEVSMSLKEKLLDIHSVDVKLYKLMRNRFERIVDNVSDLITRTPVHTGSSKTPSMRKLKAATMQSVTKPQVDFNPLNRYLSQFDLETIDREKAKTLYWQNPIVEESVKELASLVLRDLSGSKVPTSLWKTGIEHELVYWWRWMATTLGGSNRSGFINRVERGRDFQFEHLLGSIEKKELDILDIGCALTPDVGILSDKYKIRLSTIDPLASAYERILKLFGLNPHYSLMPGMAEDLISVVNDKKFDFIHAQNSLDHSADPYRAFCEIANSLKPGGVSYLLHWENEGEYHNYEEFHQWNICTNDDDQVVIWRTNEERILPLNDLAVSAQIRVFDKKKRSGINRRMIEIILTKS
jgi:SAM-dependent methyltransferase